MEAHFSAHTGYRVLLTLVLPGGDPVPFGALALTTDKQSSGIVDDQGLLYLSGLQDNSTVEVQWGATSQQRCITTIKIPSEARNAQSTMKIKMLNALCQPGSKP
ncbi:TPA: FimD/PapC C-terminal domain-containing protein [Citrobacter farmeri]